LKIELTADTRVLLPAGTLVDVSKETADVILRLGRCVVVEDAKAEEKADITEKAEVSEKAEKPKKKAAKKE
jgi:hypothetical protein